MGVETGRRLGWGGGGGRRLKGCFKSGGWKRLGGQALAVTRWLVDVGDGRKRLGCNERVAPPLPTRPADAKHKYGKGHF